MSANIARSHALSIIRDGKAQTIDLKLGQLNDQKVRRISAAERSGPRLGSLGLTVAPAAEVEGAGDNGLAIVGVEPDGKAAELGFKQGDVILKAGNKTVSIPGDLTAALSEAKAAGRKNTLFMVKRDQTNRFVAVPAAG